MNIRSLFNYLLSVFILIFCVTQSFAQQKKLSEGEIIKGKASYYGDKYHGKKTASGEVYDMEKYTAAHPNLPFGSLIQVTNLSNKKAVNLRVNDRGPYSGGRILDVSKKGAEYLEMYQDGIIEIELKVLRIGPGTVKPGTKGSVLAKNTNQYSKDKKEDNSNKSNKTDKSLQKGKNKSSKAVITNNNKSKNITASTKTVKNKTSKVKSNKNNSNTSKKAIYNGKPVKVFKPKMTYNVWGTPKNPSGYGIQLGSFATQEKAQLIAKEAIKLDLKEVYIQTGWSNNKIVYRLLYGADENQNRLRKNIPKVISKGFSGVFIKKHFD